MTFAHWVDMVQSVLGHSNTGDVERHRPLVRLFSFMTGPNGLISHFYPVGNFYLKW